ncbi:MAG: hypothetical protein ACRD82_07875 [Blastocatellia bacterium]
MSWKHCQKPKPQVEVKQGESFMDFGTQEKILKAVILDWAGTAVDYSSCAPAAAFLDVFFRHDVEITMDWFSDVGKLFQLLPDAFLVGCNCRRNSGDWLLGLFWSENAKTRRSRRRSPSLTKID